MTNLNRRKFLKFILKATGVLAVIKILGLGWASNVKAWTEPTATPPSANMPVPLNVGTGWQEKSGGIGLNVGNQHANGLVVPNGNVGIGTGVPTRILGLGGAAARNIGMERGTVADTVGFALTINAGGATSGGTNRAGGNLLLTSGVSTGNAVSNVIIQTSGGGASGTADRTVLEVMRITGVGNVGIGTASPGVRLHVVETVTNEVGVRITGSGTRRIDFIPNLGAGGWNPLSQAGDFGLIFAEGTSGTGNLVIGPHSTSPAGIRITAAGNVGIGTAAPAQRLHVAGSATIDATLHAPSRLRIPVGTNMFS